MDSIIFIILFLISIAAAYFINSPYLLNRNLYPFDLSLPLNFYNPEKEIYIDKDIPVFLYPEKIALITFLLEESKKDRARLRNLEISGKALLNRIS